VSTRPGLQDAATTPRALRVLYVAYWGLLEPLGQSLIAPAVVGLARRGVEIDLVTFEKKRDLTDGDAMRRMQLRLSDAGVRWTPLSYHKRLKPLAKLLDVAVGLAVCVRLALRRRIHLVHGRTFIGGFAACLAARLTGRPWIYHGEGFWPEQQVEAGFWDPGSAAFRLTHALDEWLHGQAEGIILLSRASMAAVAAMPKVARRKPPIVVVPSCVDLDRFPPPTDRRSGALRLVYAGSLGGRYIHDLFGRFLGVVRELDPAASLRVYSHSDLAPTIAALEATTVPRDSWAVRHAQAEEVPRLLAQCDVGLLFQKSGRGSESGSPTKVGEYWAAGLPVVCTAGCGDVDGIVRERMVGVVLADLAEGTLHQAAAALVTLLKEPGIAVRCREAAADHYALNPHLEVQLSLYHQVASVPGAGSTSSTKSTACPE
jgi:glycosyltransferase involved in cell wall biosynthesis